ncbi:hypothetical protein H2201_001565 [Coniosporium apollinis]|uniref:Wax synthase domain-containing protein n=1 Tax=Coniosporium apollinis TaxID=61459 RepID=A0ABQ9P490_9PEZI|nr:hypothetical protein H2201_001565 [Coniosporium apollinis]
MSNVAFDDSSLQFPPSFRSWSEVIIKTITWHFTGLAAAGCVTALRGVPRDRQWKYYREVLHFLYSPTYPAGQLLLNATKVGYPLLNKKLPGGDWEYFLGCVAGMEAAVIPSPGSPPTRFVPLILVPPGVAQHETQPRDAWWVGTLVPPLVVFAQCVGQLISFSRRADKDAIWALDSRNLLATVGILGAVLNTWIISIPNLAWSVTPGTDPAVIPASVALDDEELRTEVSALRFACLLMLLIHSHSDDENAKMVRGGWFHGLSPGFLTAYSLVAVGVCVELGNGFVAWYSRDRDLVRVGIPGWLVFHMGGIVLLAIELVKDVDKFQGCPESCKIPASKRYFWKDPWEAVLFI